jgi:DNA-binding transcriptional LysR family regulator
MFRFRIYSSSLFRPIRKALLENNDGQGLFIELHQIRHFVAVARAGSFTKGAELAAVSQPALSASIGRLEAGLKVKLLDRQRTKVTPTISGYKLLNAATEILRDCDSLQRELRRISSPRILRIGVLRTVASQKIATFLRFYRQVDRDVMIELIDGTHEELQKALSSKLVDIIVTRTDKKPSKFFSQVMFTENYCLVAPVDHPLARLDLVKLEQLHDQPFIVRTSCENFADTTKLLSTLGIKTRPVYKTDQDDRVLSLVEAGMGLAIIPSQPVNDRIRKVDIADLDIERTIGLRWSPKRGHDELSKLIEFAGTFDWSTAPAN